MKLLLFVLILNVPITPRVDLFELIKLGNLKAIQELQECGGNLNQYNDKGFSSLFYSIEVGNNAIVDLLIGGGSDLNYTTADGVSTFHWALIVACLEDFENSSFHITRNIRLLLEAGASINIKMIQENSLFHEFSKTHNLYPLYSAALKTDMKTHDFLRVVRKGNFSKISSLIDEVDLDVQNIFYYPELKYSPIHISIINKHFKIFEFLVQKHCNINIKTAIGKYTPLILASSRGQTSYVKILVANNAELNHVNNFGNTALMEAILNSENLSSIIDILEILLTAGANQDIENHKGETFSEFVEEMLSQGEKKELLNSAAGKFLQGQ